MRFIYVDEAGIAASEPVTVVVGIIVHADTHWKAAESLIHEICDRHVPPEVRSNFIFHAKDVYSGGKQVDRSTWDFDKRRAFIHEIVSLPRQLSMAISLGIMRRDAEARTTRKMSQEQFQHMLAFGFCMARADEYIRNHTSPEEVGTIVAEEAPHMRLFLRIAIEALRSTPTLFSPGLQIPTKAQKVAGVLPPAYEEKVSRIVDSVHFADKKDALLLQLADACAFSFRRYFSLQGHGEQFVASMLGEPLEMEDWLGPHSGGLFVWPSTRLVRTTTWQKATWQY